MSINMLLIDTSYSNDMSYCKALNFVFWLWLITLVFCSYKKLFSLFMFSSVAKDLGLGVASVAQRYR